MTTKHYTLKQRALYRVAALLGVQLHRLRDDGSIQPGLFYSGWRYRAQQTLSRLMWPVCTFGEW